MAQDPWGWVYQDPPTGFDRLDVTWITHESFLIPMEGGGAVLRWVYQQTENQDFSMVVGLTEEEAQRVFEAGSDVGMLEPVRESLYWRGALMTVTDVSGRATHSWRYVIQPHYREEEFVRDMMSPPAKFYSETESKDLRYLEGLLAGVG